MEYALQETAVRAPANAFFNLVHAPGRPGVHRRIHIAKSPFIGRQLPVGMHVPFTQQQNELLLGKVRIDQRQRHRVKGQVPRRKPRVLPFVGHRKDVRVVKVRPIVIAPFLAFRRRRRLAGIAIEPGAHVVVIALLGPQHARERLPHARCARLRTAPAESGAHKTGRLRYGAVRTSFRTPASNGFALPAFGSVFVNRNRSVADAPGAILNVITRRALRALFAPDSPPPSRPRSHSRESCLSRTGSRSGKPNTR